MGAKNKRKTSKRVGEQVISGLKKFRQDLLAQRARAILIGEKPAYPTSGSMVQSGQDSIVEEGHPGMTLREHYAGKAMEAMIIGVIMSGRENQVSYRVMGRNAVIQAGHLVNALAADENNQNDGGHDAAE